MDTIQTQQSIQPIKIHKDRLNLISYLYLNSFTGSYRRELENSKELLKQPLMKIAILGEGTSYFDRLFVCEETPTIIMMVKNMIFESDRELPIRRTIFSIVRSKLKYVHYDTGIIFDDLLDYAHIEPDEVNKYFKYYYEQNYYDNIKDISSKDSDYKSKVLIYDVQSGQVFYNNMYYYNFYKRDESLLKVGYYIQNSSCVNLHPVLFCSKLFGLLPNMMKGTEYMYFQQLLVSYNSDLNFISRSLLDVNLTKYSDGKSRKYNSNLIDSLLANNSQKKEYVHQNNRMLIGSFIAEILYSFFFY